MEASFIQIIVLAVIQGVAELLPVSSSAHVIVAERLMHLDPSSPHMTFLLVMLHTGTMFSVIVYFWSKWRAVLIADLGSQGGGSRQFLQNIVIATFCTGIIGFGLKALIEHVLLPGGPKAEIESLFKNLPLIAASLCTAGLLIIWTGLRYRDDSQKALTGKIAVLVGAVQGLCLPFRGFSRSGATISTGIIQGLSRDLAESFSFALAVVLTPPVIAKELLRLLKATSEAGESLANINLFLPGLTGMAFSFLAGLLALRWLSAWLEKGRWHFFGFYCLFAAAMVLLVDAVTS